MRETQTMFHGAPEFGSQPPPYEPVRPSSGYRIALDTNQSFTQDRAYSGAGKPPCYDADGKTPVYFGSAKLRDSRGDSWHPCKVIPSFANPCRVPYAGLEHEHEGRYDLLPFTDNMELIPASDGLVPPGRVPIVGGTENGVNLYHAVAVVDGIFVPGKCAEHLGGANVAFGSAEVHAKKYSLLVWKQ